MSAAELLERAVQLAIEVRDQAYAPYSGFHVGAVVETESGELFTGCNVENASYGNTICAERVALTKAVSEGHRRMVRVVVATNAVPPAGPCGLCRQFMAEFASDDMEIVLVNMAGARSVHSLGELLPMAFRPDALQS